MTSTIKDSEKSVAESSSAALQNSQTEKKAAIEEKACLHLAELIQKSVDSMTTLCYEDEDHSKLS